MSSSSSSADGSSSSPEPGRGAAHETKKEDADKAGKKSKNKEEIVTSGSDSDSNSASDSSSSSDEKDKKKKKKAKAKKEKKDKKDEKEKKKKKDKKAGKSSKQKKKNDKSGKKGKDAKKKKMNKAKKRMEKSKRDAVSNQYGKYGVLKAEDFFNKKAEFLTWALEVRKANTDALGQMQLKDLFKEYIEDYNTATMPTKKYYNLQSWDALQQRKRHKKNRSDDMTEAQKSALASFDDERARKEEMKNIQMKKQENLIADEVNKMRGNKEKVEEMRAQNRLATQRDNLNKAGFSVEASKIDKKLDPNKREAREYNPSSA